MPDCSEDLVVPSGSRNFDVGGQCIDLMGLVGRDREAKALKKALIVGTAHRLLARCLVLFYFLGHLSKLSLQFWWSGCSDVISVK